MRKLQRYEPKQLEFSILVTLSEVNLVSNMLYIALNNMPLDDFSKKMARDFIVKLQRAALENKQSTH